MKKPLKSIPINIWDDYYDDGYVPDGKIQATYAYIEEYDVLTDEDKEPIIQVFYDYLKTLNLEGVELNTDGCLVFFKHLTHRRREKLVEELEQSKLQHEGIPFGFYSES